ncbi:MAG: M48 family metallopeptidase [Armatimonadota bacterium]
MQGRIERGITRWLVLSSLLVLAVIGFAAGDPGLDVENQYGLYPDFAANLRVQMIGHRIALAAETPQASFKIFNNKDLNAFALPDGRIYITSLMATLVTDDELAYVLGHEITHVKEGHAKNQIKRATGGALLGAILVAVLGGDMHDVRTGADIAGGLTYGHYSRKDELKADRGGVMTMTRCGYDPKKAADAMQRLIDKYGSGDAKVPILGWFATHPDSKDRKARILQLSDEMAKKPPTPLAAPQGIEISPDPTALHASTWLHDYLALRIAAYANGRYVVLPAGKAGTTVAQQPAVISEIPLRLPATVAAAADAKSTDNKAKAKGKTEEPLQPVTVVFPQVPVAYRVTVSLQRIPAEHATNLEASRGTAVEAILRWSDVKNGFNGECRAMAQTDKELPWMAQDQLKDAVVLTKLQDGRERNLEGTLEATAVRRAAMAFAEVLEADSAIDHSVPVTIRMTDPGKVRPGDYINVVRGNKIVACVNADQITGKDVKGTVLWGVHTWKKGDKFVMEQ